MANFYIVVFLVGVFYTFVSLIISGVTGAVHSHGDFGANVDGHFGQHGHLDSGHIQTDAGHVAHAGHFHGGHSTDGSQVGNVDGHNGHSAGDSSGLSHSVISWFALILNPLVAVSFLTVFGGMGIMGTNYFKWNIIIIFIVAIASGIVVSAILYNFVAKPIYRSENTSDVSRKELIGTAAEVTTDILANGFGTIKYTVNSIMFTAPAKHIDEKAVMQGEKVVICKIEDNIFYISEVSSILN
jgi:membrane protein implicated in regulation of membrane protease activity